ncbi:contractile injection system protein, VgrG/Pvc8 family [Hafnia paralvei]|uniref:contractile injection system protein, VgrG/Pvc8 family n=1 Tax=Hafnia paralvei TaxID=546367 RepID=UPI001F1D1CF8|nr:contractile injection system protein, VgrG/Pvc8 family [Hafnia paralvei]MCE9902509.1 late control protein D [Hafnia paralvei]MCE9921782.1 late control protein D [Hafnia paralvei]
MNGVEEYRPEFSVTAEGKDISKALRQCLQELTLTDNGGATGKADELQITLLSETLPLPSKGARLQLGLGFNGNLVDKGWFVVSGVSSSGPPRKVVIYATAAPMNAQKQSGDVQNQKTRSWDNLTLGDIVKTVATDNGLIPKVADKLAAIAVPHLDQVSESDANLLTRLARSHNAVSKPSGGYWLFLEQGAALTASGKTLADVTIVPSEVSNWTYSEGQRGSTTGKPSSGGKEKKGKIGVKYYDEDTGQTKVVQTEHDGPDLENPYTQSHKAQADQQAKAKKTQAKRNERRMNITAPCRPQHLPLTAEARVTTQGFGQREDRSWLIESMVYSLSAMGFSVAFNLATDIKPKAASGKKKKEKKDKTGPEYFGKQKN